MATYCFKCKTCGHRETNPVQGDLWDCCDDPRVIRDYRSENVGAALGNLKAERENGGREGVKDLFLPNNRDFAGPGDPDGTKGMRNWRDEHQPKAGNSAPDWPGTVEKKVF